MGALATDRACQFMMLSSLLVAVGRTVDGFMVRSVHPVTYTFSLCVTTLIFLSAHLALTGRLAAVKNIFRRKWRSGALAGAVDTYS